MKVTGKYKDVGLVTAKYRNQFMRWVGTLAPEVIEELVQIIEPLTLLSDERSKEELVEDLLSVRSNLIGFGLACRDVLTDYQRPRLNSDFIWFEISELLNLIGMEVFDSENSLDSELPEGVRKIHFHLYPMIEGGRREIVNQFGQSSVAAFTETITKLIEWGVRNNLNRDWIIECAIDYLFQMIESPKINFQELKDPIDPLFFLRGMPFRLHLREWLPGVENRSDYERFVIKKVKERLPRYIDRTSRRLELFDETKVTKPIDYDRTRWLVRYTVQNWTKDQILDEIYDLRQREKPGIKGDQAPDVETIRKAFSEFERFGLPIRTE